MLSKRIISSPSLWLFVTIVSISLAVFPVLAQGLQNPINNATLDPVREANTEISRAFCYRTSVRSAGTYGVFDFTDGAMRPEFEKLLNTYSNALNSTNQYISQLEAQANNDPTKRQAYNNEINRLRPLRNQLEEKRNAMQDSFNRMYINEGNNYSTLQASFFRLSEINCYEVQQSDRDAINAHSAKNTNFNNNLTEIRTISNEITRIISEIGRVQRV